MPAVIKTSKKNPTICSNWVKLEGYCQQYPHITMPSVIPVTHLPSTPESEPAQISQL